jgi:hypothetical protein
LALNASWQPGTTTARRAMIAFRRMVDFFMGLPSFPPYSTGASQTVFV